MDEYFLAVNISQIKETSAINLFQNIKIIPIATPINSQAISTAYIHQGSNGTPILLLHGFESSLLEFRLLKVVAIFR